MVLNKSSVKSALDCRGESWNGGTIRGQVDRIVSQGSGSRGLVCSWDGEGPRRWKAMSRWGGIQTLWNFVCSPAVENTQALCSLSFLFAAHTNVELEKSAKRKQSNWFNSIDANEWHWSLDWRRKSVNHEKVEKEKDGETWNRVGITWRKFHRTKRNHASKGAG